MAAIQYERDLRSADIDFKRTKDSAIKWSYGVRPLAGTRINQMEPGMKVRPAHKASDECYPRKVHRNVNKEAGRWAPANRMRSFAAVHEELDDPSSRSIVDLLGSPKRKVGAGTVSTVPAASTSVEAAAMHGILYSFDNTDTPPPALALDVFVKHNVRATEKLVAKEYEVLDVNGDAVKGRKARQVLRQEATATTASTSASLSLVAAASTLDDEEFELV